ncbi:MAG: nitronate monooxygenase [Candidatus Lokiarchaeota archaeon]|nr:nitronate monooxygenase [Candidatus Lokiarchaeota archaeon]
MIKTRLTELFGLKYPIISAPMGPFYTTKLTVAVSEAGGLGVLSHATLKGKNSVNDMIAQLEYVIEHTDKSFGVNIRTARLQTDHKIMLRKIIQNIKQNPKLREQLVYIVTSAGGSKFASKLLKEKTPDVTHFHVSPALWLVDKSFAAGCDGVCATGTEGGGHQSYEGITTLVLVSQVAQKYPDKLLVACGGIASPETVAAGLSMGADAVAMGTRFIASTESEFHPNYKALIPPATAQDTMITTGGFGPIRLLKNKYCLEHGKTLTKEEKIAQESALDMDSFLEDLYRYEIVYTQGDVENGAVPAGQTCGMIDSIMDVEDIITGFSNQAEKILKNLATRIS